MLSTKSRSWIDSHESERMQAGDPITLTSAGRDDEDAAAQQQQDSCGSDPRHVSCGDDEDLKRKRRTETWVREPVGRTQTHGGSWRRSGPSSAELLS